MVEGWVQKTFSRLRRREVSVVTFEGVWRGGCKRRLLTNDGFTHRWACEEAMKRAKEWEPPPDRIQARLWDAQKRYRGALTWRIKPHARSRVLTKGEVPQRRVENPPEAAPAAPEVASAPPKSQEDSNVMLTERLSQLEATLEASVGAQAELCQRLEAVEAENRKLRGAMEAVLRELFQPDSSEVYKRFQKLYRELELYWEEPKPLSKK